MQENPLKHVNHKSLIKLYYLQGYEDRLRHKADNEVNNREAYVVRDGKVAQVKSMDITVIKLSINQQKRIYFGCTFNLGLRIKHVFLGDMWFEMPGFKIFLEKGMITEQQLTVHLV